MSFIGDAISGIFGGGGGGGSMQPSSTQTVQTQIPGFLEDVWKDDIVPDARGLYGSGPREYFPGHTVTPFSDPTMQGLAQMEGLAANPEFPDAVAGGLLDVLNRGGQTENFGTYSQPMQDIAFGNTAIDTSRLEDIAGGSMLGANPYLDDVIGLATEEATQAANRDAWFGGREGSPYAAGAIAEGVARATLPIRYGDYQQERGYMQGAINQLPQVEGANIANQFGASQGLLGADIDAANREMQAFGAAPGAYHFQAAPADYLMRVGSALESKESENIADQIARFDFEQNADWDNLSRYITAISGAPIASGTTTTSYQPQSGFSAAGLLGGGLAGSQLGSMLGASYTPYGALGGALLGGFG